MHLTRSRKLVLLSALATALLAFGIWQLFAPDEYEASTLILVDPQHLPDSYVHSTVPGFGLRLTSIKQQLMSSTRLQRIIDTFDLYKSLKGHKTQEEIFDRMRSDIRVEVVHGFDGMPDDGVRAFRISYRGYQAPLVAQVCNQLASMFIDENLKDREQQAVGTSEFIRERLNLAKKAVQQAQESIRTAKSNGDRAVAALELSVLHENYISLLKKRLEADAVVDLETRQRGERLMIFDPAIPPEKPVRRYNFLTAGW